MLQKYKKVVKWEKRGDIAIMAIGLTLVFLGIAVANNYMPFWAACFSLFTVGLGLRLFEDFKPARRNVYWKKVK